jgi:hypothetical protein
MSPDEDEFPDVCASCGAAVTVDAERSYAYGPSGVLCHACATRRGGVYDATRDRWVVEPDLADLPDERRPHR